MPLLLLCHSIVEWLLNVKHTNCVVLHVVVQILRHYFCQLSGVYRCYIMLYFVLCVKNRLLHLKLPSYNRHVSYVTKFLLKGIAGLWMSVGCLFSSSPRSCMPCVWHFAWPGSRPSPSSYCHLNPSYGTCDGARFPVHYGVVKAGRPRWHLSPGSWQLLLCCPFWGWPWKNPHGCCSLCHCLACLPGLQWPSWRRAQGTLFCGCAVPNRRRRFVSSIFRSHSWHCSTRLLCGSGMTSHPPPPA